MTTKNLEQLIETLGRNCKEYHCTLVTAESCTGGGIAFNLTRSQTCSSLLERGYITYSNQSKENVLNVKPESLQLHGAVSEVVVVEMAEGALKNSLAQIAIAVTGIAAEDMESEGAEGIAWIAIASTDGETLRKKISFKGRREKFINFTILESIKYLISVLTTKNS